MPRARLTVFIPSLYCRLGPTRKDIHVGAKEVEEEQQHPIPPDTKPKGPGAGLDFGKVTGRGAPGGVFGDVHLSPVS